MSHIHPRGGLLCIINVCRQQGLHRRHCRNQQFHINTTKRTHWLSSLLPAAVMRVSSYTLMLTQCFPATLHMVTLSTEWVKTRRGTALAGSCSLTEQETQPFAVTIVLVSDNWGGWVGTVSTKVGQKMFVCVAGVSASRSWCMSFGLDRHVAITGINKENVSWYSGSKGSILWEMFIIWLQIRIRTR